MDEDAKPHSVDDDGALLHSADSTDVVADAEAAPVVQAPAMVSPEAVTLGVGVLALGQVIAVLYVIKLSFLYPAAAPGIVPVCLSLLAPSLALLAKFLLDRRKGDKP